MIKHKLASFVIIWLCLPLLIACGGINALTTHPQEIATPTLGLTEIDREEKIPNGAVKMSPTSDEHPPMIYSRDYDAPVPLPGDVNTAGAEDSPFITLDGNTLYFFFTPDVTVPIEKQLLDKVTGIYASRKIDGAWGPAHRVILQDPGKLSLDGCEYVQGDIMWFCSTREGYTGLHWFTAEYLNGVWQGWKLADFDPGFEVGELHISLDGTQLYFASGRSGGQGGLDIWMMRMVNGNWQEPINIRTVNTQDSEGWPALNQPGDELWFTRNYGIWRSKSVNGEWQPAELVVSPLAGEPSIDQDGNLYFVHHYYHDDTMIEADIYFAHRK